MLVLVLQRRQDLRQLRDFVGDIDSTRLTPREVVVEVAKRCYLLPFRKDPAFYPRLFGSLGATPSAVIQFGGCCSDRSRLLILALAELKIRAYQITLYHRAGHAQHCLVEADLGAERFIADPSYGFYYADPSGRSISLTDLRLGKQPIYKPFPEGETCGYPTNAYYDFDFRASRTANWTKTRVRRLAYRVLRSLSGSAVDRLEVPALLEWPQHLFILIAAASAIAVHVAVALLVAL